MKTSKELVRLIRESEIITDPGVDDRILQDARNELVKRQQGRTEPGGVLWRTLMKTKKTTFATASMIVIVALIVFQFVGNPVGSSLTFAQVIEPILKAHTVACDVVSGTTELHCLFMGSRSRLRIAGSKEVFIGDKENGRNLVLNEEKLEARYFNLKGLSSLENFQTGTPLIQDYLEDLKNTILRLKDMPDFTVEELGRKKLDGHEVVVFFASYPDGDFAISIWADAETGRPVRIEQNQGVSHIIIKNIEFEPRIEEGMLSLEVPPGYTVQEHLTMDVHELGTEENFIKGLRLIAEKLNFGRFPDDVTLKYFIMFNTSRPVHSQLNAMPKEKGMALYTELAKYTVYISLFTGEGEWTYRGKGVRLGEVEKPIFWYKPQGSETYRVIYGDLHVENVDPEDLPE